MSNRKCHKQQEVCDKMVKTSGRLVLRQKNMNEFLKTLKYLQNRNEGSRVVLRTSGHYKYRGCRKHEQAEWIGFPDWNIVSYVSRRGRTAATGTNQLAYADLIRRTLTQPGKENEVKIQMRPSITLPDGSALPAALRQKLEGSETMDLHSCMTRKPSSS